MGKKLHMALAGLSAVTLSVAGCQSSSPRLGWRGRQNGAYASAQAPAGGTNSSPNWGAQARTPATGNIDSGTRLTTPISQPTASATVTAGTPSAGPSLAYPASTAAAGTGAPGPVQPASSTTAADSFASGSAASPTTGNSGGPNAPTPTFPSTEGAPSTSKETNYQTRYPSMQPGVPTMPSPAND
jgi:hypothetical protein